jgi:predicted ArsR family transcriptional regulator
MAYVKTTGTDKITTQELAQRFDITIRNANRILTNLCNGGVATLVYTQTTHSRGRPVKVYELNFN